MSLKRIKPGEQPAISTRYRAELLRQFFGVVDSYFRGQASVGDVLHAHAQLASNEKEGAWAKVTVLAKALEARRSGWGT